MKTTANNYHDHENNHNLLLDDLGSLLFNAKSDGLLGQLIGNKVSFTKVKWMFIFWIGQVGMMLGILFALFKR